MRVIDRRDWRDNIEHGKQFFMCIIYIYIYLLFDYPSSHNRKVFHLQHQCGGFNGSRSGEWNYWVIPTKTKVIVERLKLVSLSPKRYFWILYMRYELVASFITMRIVNNIVLYIWTFSSWKNRVKGEVVISRPIEWVSISVFRYSSIQLRNIRYNC